MKKRDYPICCIRVSSMVFIILYHLFQYYGVKTHFNVGVYIFLCMSGYLYGNKKIENWVFFYIRNFIKILLDMYLVLIPFLIIAFFDSDYPLKLESVIKQFFLIDGQAIGGVCHLWFIPYILGCYILIPLFYALIDGIKNERFVFQGFFLLSTMAIIVIIGIGRFNSACIISFFIGMFISRLSECNNTTVYKRILYLVAVLSVVLQALYDCILINTEGLEEEAYIFVHVYILAFVGCALFFFFKDFLSKKFGKTEKKERKKFAFALLELDKLSYDIYLVHFPLILSKSCCIIDLFDNDVLGVLFVIVVTLIVAYVVNYTSKMINSIIFCNHDKELQAF